MRARRRPVLTLLIVVLALMSMTGATAPGIGRAAAPAAGAGTAPTLSLPGQAGNTLCDDSNLQCLLSPTSLVVLQSGFGAPIATVTTPAGLTPTDVLVQYECAFPLECASSPTGWQELAQIFAAPYTLNLNTAAGGAAPLDGIYDLRAEVTYSNGPVGYSTPLDDVALVDDETNENPDANNDYGVYVGLQDPRLTPAELVGAGTLNPDTTLSGATELIAAPEGEANVCPATVSFQIIPSGWDPTVESNWTTIGTAGPLGGEGNATEDASGLPEYEVPFDTTTLQIPGYSGPPDYDLRVTAQGFDTVDVDCFNSNVDLNPPQAFAYIGGVIDDVTIDNTQPSVTLTNPGPLSGIVSLSATAQSDAPIDSVRFEDAPAGSGDWSTIGVATSASTSAPDTYSVDFDTRNLQNGQYDLRAEMSTGGRTVDSPVIPGVTVDNGSVEGPAVPVQFSVTDQDVPANGGSSGSPIALLGEVAGSSDHETWGFGYTTAPQYATTAGTKQFVLLRYTDGNGWQIAGVLHNTDGTPYVFPTGPEVFTKVIGAMTPSGDAWIVLLVNSNGNQYSETVFHRPPNGQFVADPDATSALSGLFSKFSDGGGNVQLRLGQDAGGAVYGTLVNPGQATQPTIDAGVSGALQYGQLVTDPSTGAETWGVQTASLPTDYNPNAGDTMTLTAASPTGQGTGWGTFAVHQSSPTTNEPLFLGSFSGSGWTFVSTGLDALDLTGAFGATLWNVGDAGATTLLATSDSVWIETPVQADSGLSDGGDVVALYDPASGTVVKSWCASAILSVSSQCTSSLDTEPAAAPQAVFTTSDGATVALALDKERIDIYARGAWTSIPAPGFGDSGDLATQAVFNQEADGSIDGWIAGDNSIGELSAQAPASPLTSWPEANQATLVSVALPPAGAGIGTSGALAVGLDGTALHYDSSEGWLNDAVPTAAQGLNLLAVAYDGPSRAFAVGAFGTIIDWNGTTWSADPQSAQLTQNQLNAVAFGSDGEGWAVGQYGTILHFDGTAWSQEQVDAQDAGADITSVAVAGDVPFAVAGGYLITRGPDGTWQRVDLSALSPTLPPGALRLVSALPDGGVVAAGDSVLIERQDGSSSFEYSPQPFEGIAVALAAFRDPGSGALRAFVSVAPAINIAGTLSDQLGFPAGDGELLVANAGGFEDLSQAQYPFASGSGPASLEGGPEPDPVLAVAAASDGSAAWAVGGYAGTQTASGLGTTDPLQERPFAWQTSSIWRYDASGSAQSPSLSQATVSLPAQPNTVSFAFFSDAECESECASVSDAQPSVNLNAAAGEIADFAAQPGGPAFALLGGNAVGDQDAASRAVDLAGLPGVLAPLGGLPLYAAYGPLDGVSTDADPAQAWDQDFAAAPAPFGQGAAPAGVTPVGSGGQDGSVNHYYSYDVSQNGGTLRVIVLDNSQGSLDASDPGQSAWLSAQLAAGQAAGVPMVVFCAQPLDSDLTGAVNESAYATDADSVAGELAAAGVLAVFTADSSQSDTTHLIPYQAGNAPPVGPQIPEYEGAALGYQQTQNDGVLWYFVSVNTSTSSVSVQGIPVVQSLALQPLDGLTAARSSTLSFRAIGRRPAGTLPADVGNDNTDGIANYVSIPATSCGGCVSPSYTFTSSNPAIGNFVAPSAPGSLFPKLSSSGKTSASAQSGLFCAFNAGQTTVSVTSGLLTASLTVTVQPGNIGQPCGTVTYAPDETVDVIKPKTVSSTLGAAGPGAQGVAPAPVSKTTVPVKIKDISVPVPPKSPKTIVIPAAKHPVAPVAPTPVAVKPAPAVKPVKVPVPPAAVVPTVVPTLVIAPVAYESLPPVVVPPIPPPITPVPPGGATAPAQSTAKREEKARKHASQSAYVIRPAGASGDEWFYPAVGVMTVFAVMLIGTGMRPGPGRSPAFVEISASTDDARPQRRRRY